MSNSWWAPAGLGQASLILACMALSLGLGAACSSDGPRSTPDAADGGTEGDGDAGGGDAAPDADAALDMNDGGDVGPDTADSAGDPDAVDEADVSDTAEEPDGPLACAPALALSAPRAGVLPLGLLALEASGGTGDYRFALADNRSGAIINELTGSYLAGLTAGVTDRVAVTDEGCAGQAVLDVLVVSPLVVRPLSVELAPGTGFTFEVEAGSGTVDFSLGVDQSGATLTTEGVYVAGAVEGRDRIVIEDVVTGEQVEAEVVVTADAALVAVPAAIALPVANRFRPVVRGGSGHWEIAEETSLAALEEGFLVGLEPGQATLTLVDRFTSQSTSLDVAVAAPQDAPLPRAGDRTDAAVALGPGDLDGDGFADAVLGVPEADITGLNAGAVLVYHGSQDGLLAEPVQVLAGITRNEQLGRSARVAELTGDGRPDLVAAAPFADIIAGNSGTVSIFAGNDEGTFDDEPVWQWHGLRANDNVGEALAVCDVDGDGRDDLIVGASRAEDVTVDPIPADQGAIFVFYASDEGFAATPDLVRYGTLPDEESAWAPAAGLRLGTGLAGGDLDGDDDCDLVVAAFAYNSNDGAFFVYESDAAEPEGLTRLPRRAVAAPVEQPDGFLAQWLAAGDFNGDGLDDVAVSHYRYAAGGNRRGAARVFWGEAFADTAAAALESTDAADWLFTGAVDIDEAGWNVAFGEVTGDDRLDLLVSIRAGEVAGGAANAGTVAVFAGSDGGGTPSNVPATVLAGAVANDFFGQTVAALGDADGDEVGDYLVHVAADATLGYQVGLPYFVSGAEPTTTLGLGFPGEASGHDFGRGLEWVGDLDNDGDEELAVGATLADWAVGPGLSGGAVFLYAGEPGGAALDAPIQLGGWVNHSGSDQLGWAVSGAGDFNGDGFDDLALVARFEDRPASFNASYANRTDCPGTRNNSGAVFVLLGADGALPTAPAFVYYGPDADGRIDAVAGGEDVNGDGYDDLVVGSPNWSGGLAGSGGFAVLLGRPAAATGITVICTEALLVRGELAGVNLGRAVAMVGDVDADGCAEVAAGAPLEDRGGRTNQGGTWVLSGWGGVGCPTDAEVSVVVPDAAAAQSGSSLAGGGRDADGDGVPDLAVGAPFFIQSGITPGAAYLVSGAYLAGLPRFPASGPIGATAPLVAPADTARRRVVGAVHLGELGRSVALVPAEGAAGGLLAGSPRAEYSGVFLSGGAVWHSWAAEVGLGTEAVWAFGGETERAEGRLGEAVAVAVAGGQVIAAVAGYQASALSLDAGAAYVVSAASPPAP